MKALIFWLLIYGVAIHSSQSEGLTGNECYGQPHGALIPYPGDCTKFLVCEWYDGTVMNCPAGLHFNPVLCVCDWPTSAGCTQGSNPTVTPTTITSTSPTTPTPVITTSSTTILDTTSDLPPISSTESPDPVPTLTPDDNVCIDSEDGAYFPYPYNCSWYIRCEGRLPIVEPCPTGWIFNSILEICDYPENTVCEEIPYPTTTSISTSSPTIPTPSSSTTSATSSDLPPISSTESPDPVPTLTPDDNVCIDSEDGAYFPYPYNCSWYIRCEGRLPIVEPCPTGWIFNSILEICDYPENTVCEEIPYPTTTSISTSSPTIPTPSSSTTSATSSDLPPISSTESPDPVPTLTPDDNVCIDSQDGTYFPYPYNCSWYIRCEGRLPIVEPCPTGWIFNSILEICDYPENTVCEEIPYPTTTSISTSSPTMPTPSSSTTTSDTTSDLPPISSTESPDPVPTLTPDDNVCIDSQDGTYFPYPYNCSWYIRCEGRLPIVEPCPTGWIFNSILEICDYPENTVCEEIPYPTTTSILTSTPTSTSTPASISSTTPIPTSPTTTLTPSTELTNQPTIEPGDDVCVDQPDGTLLPYPYDCEWYIRCENNNALVLLCEDGRIFNTILEICDYRENTECIEIPYGTTKVSTEISTTTSISPNSSESTPITTLPTLPTPPTPSWPSSSTSPTSSETTSDPELTDACANQPEGILLPYPQNCTMYIRCDPDTTEVRSCDDNKVFNPILRICDFPDNVNCVATIYPPTATTPIQTTDKSTTPQFTLPTAATPTTQSTSSTTPTDSSSTSESRPTPPTHGPGLTTPTSTLSPIISTTPEGDGSSTEPPYVGKGVCANQEFGSLVPYPGHCSLYIICVQPTPVAISCDPGLEFSAEEKICQKPEDAGCSIIKTTTTTAAPTTAEPTTAEPTTAAPTTAEPTTAEPTTTPSINMGICSSYPPDTLIPYPGNCSQYIRCELPAPAAFECPGNLEFNAVLQLCESAESAGCSSFPSTTTIPPEIPTTTPLPTEPGLTGICRGQQLGDLIPYPGNCNKYIICKNPIPIAQKCSSDLYFNAELGICDEPDEQGCSNESGATTVNPTTSQPPNNPGMTGLCKGHAEGDLISYPNSCTKYIRCEIPVPVAQTCESGLFFNDILGICDTGENENCPGYTTTPIPGPSDGSTTTTASTTTSEPPTMTGLCRDQQPGDSVPYPENCNKYILCEYPIPQAKSCPNGLHYNVDLQICDDPASAGCEPVSSTTTSNPTSEPPDSNVCCGVPIGTLVPYPEDCTQYIRCNYPIPGAFLCPDGLHYSPVSEICEPKETAKCEWYTTTTSTTTTTTQAPLTCATQPNGTLLPIEGNCRSYYYCSGGSSVPLPCTPGTIFSYEHGGCIIGDTCLN